MRYRYLMMILTAGALLGLSACQESSQPNARFSVSLHANYIHPDKTDFQFVDAAGGSMQFTVTSQDTPWQITNLPEWVTVSPSSGTTTTNVTVTVSAHTWAASRAGVFTLSSGTQEWNYSKQISVTQAGATPYLTLGKREFSFGGPADSETVSASSNFNWEFNKHGNDWITITNTGSQMTVSATANDTFAPREGTVDILCAGSILGSITVSQVEATVSVKADPLNYEIGSGAYSLTITSEADWNTSTAGSWISVDPSSGGPGTTEVTVSVTPNDGVNERDGSVYFRFRNSGLQIAEIPVHQDGVVLELAVDEWVNNNVSSKGGTLTFQLTTNISWNITSSPEFLTFTPSSGTGSTLLTATISENPSLTDARGGYLIISDASSTRWYQRDYYFRQRSAGEYSLDQTWIECNDVAQTVEVRVLTDAQWGLQQVYGDFYTYSPAVSSGDGVIAFDVRANTGLSNRQGETDFYLYGLDGYPDGQLAAYLYINQTGWKDKYHEVPQAVELPVYEGTMDVDIATNDAWEAEFLTSASWIRFDGKSKAADAGKLKFAFDENPGAATRSVRIRINFEHLESVEMTLTQVGRGIRLETDALYFFSQGGTNRVLFSADGLCSFTAEGGDWFTVYADSYGSFTVYAEPLEGDGERDGKITIELQNLPSGSCRVVLPVIQMSAAAYTRSGFKEDRDLDICTGSAFSIQVNGYTADQNWSGGRRADISGEGYDDDENWN